MSGVPSDLRACASGSHAGEPGRLESGLQARHDAHVGLAWHGLDPAWPDTAACRDHPDLPADAWFDGRSSVVRAEVRAVCAGCPVLARCREWAVTSPALVTGIFGGLTGAERIAERNRRRKAAALAELRSRSARAAQQAAKETCDHGHDLTDPANVRLEKRPSGASWRVCKICKRRTRNASERLRRAGNAEQVRAAARARYAARRAPRQQATAA